MSEFNLERRNFENLCHIYKTKLWRIHHGGSAFELLNSSERRRLRDAGVLGTRYGRLIVSGDAQLELLKIKDNLIKYDN